MTRTRNGVAAALLPLAVAGCASLGAEGDRPPGAMAGEAHVEVVNNNWLDVVIYAVKPGTRARLGTVASMGTETFRIPPFLVSTTGSVALLADPIGSTRAHRTDRILLQDGDRIHWTLENVLAQSSYRVSGGYR